MSVALAKMPRNALADSELLSIIVGMRQEAQGGRPGRWAGWPASRPVDEYRGRPECGASVPVADPHQEQDQRVRGGGTGSTTMLGTVGAVA